VLVLSKLRPDPRERERRRRLAVHANGRSGNGMITEVEENIVFYSYTVGGVGYAASQDLSQLHELLPEELGRLVGPVLLKYAPANPANSIVLCEEWSGLRETRVSVGHPKAG
jgi:hypothetical protein